MTRGKYDKTHVIKLDHAFLRGHFTLVLKGYRTIQQTKKWWCGGGVYINLQLEWVKINKLS